ncbi:11265_t:CDS:1 [Diversispora eburnea]|uniref:11265_t:CDS:1 n=1 Tax=Diversispora eburnea TaxID=1213867 RepID=A0A9N8VWR6_9GLOM|nr:11265_t:CDS:1 [Diversispora eburnea]
MPPRSQLIKCAIISSIFTIIWNLAEGVISTYFGAESSSLSLIFFGINAFIEVISASLVLWRFKTEMKSEDENSINSKEENLKKERRATVIMGNLFISLSLGTIINATVALIKKRQPDTALPTLIISSVSLSFMLFLWLGKRYLAFNLDSAILAAEAQCSLACLEITGVIFLGSLLYVVWSEGWWLDSTAALFLGLLFAKDGIEMILSANSKNFDGGCNSKVTAKVHVEACFHNRTEAVTKNGNNEI